MNSALHCLLSEVEFVFHTVILSEVEGSVKMN